MCVNFDKLTEWRKENSIDMSKYERMTKQRWPGVKQGPPIPGWTKYYGEDGLREWNSRHPSQNASWLTEEMLYN